MQVWLQRVGLRRCGLDDDAGNGSGRAVADGHTPDQSHTSSTTYLQLGTSAWAWTVFHERDSFCWLPSDSAMMRVRDFNGS